MLKLDGNAEQTFASHNSINMNPLVYAEWNYNNFYRPYIVNSQQFGSDQIYFPYETTNFNPSSAASTAADNSYITNVRTNQSAIKLNYTSSRNSISLDLSNISGIGSGSGYYKVVFYAKANITIASGKPNSILPTVSIISPGVSAGSTASSNFYFNVIPVAQNGYKPPFKDDLSDMASAGPFYYTSASSVNNGSASITWTHDTNAIAYDIYKSEVAGVPKFIQTQLPQKDANNNILTEQSASFNTASVNNVFVAPTSIMSSPVITNSIMLSPRIDLFKETTDVNPIDGTSFYTNLYESESSEPTINKSSFSLDGTTYNKFEIYFYAPASFKKISLVLKALSQTNLSEYSIFIDKVFFSQVDSWQYDVNDFYSINSAFYSSRPGESLLNPFLPVSERKLRDTTSKPVSYGYYNPDGMEFTSPRKNLLTSQFSKFNYYISDTIENDTTLTYVVARYDNAMSINKIILKYNNTLTKMNGAKIKLFNSSGTQIGSDISISSGGDVAEYIILYYQGGTWKQIDPTKEPSENNYSPASLTDSGLIQGTVDNVCSIELSTKVIRQKVANHIKRRLHLIELSPRLEINISSLVKSLSINKTIDAKDSVSSFPIGYMSANTATIEVSNIPVYLNQKPHTIFENLAEKSTFKSLLREGVKITGAFVSPQQDFTETIPAFSMYVNSWSITGVDSLNISCMDAAKYLLMSKEPPQYSSKNENIFDTYMNILSTSGISDFDYDKLKEILDPKLNKTTYFWTDITSTIYELFSNFFIVHQIGSWFDEYGIMRFTNLDNIINTYSSNSFRNTYVNFAVTDKVIDNVGNSSVTYIPNLMGDGYSHDISARPGKIIINYKTPITVTNTDVLDNSGFASDTVNKGQNTTRISVAPQAVFGLKDNNLLPYSYLKEGLYQTDSSIKIDTSVINDNKSGLYSFSGDAFIGGEIVGWSGMEYEFYTAGASTTSNYKMYLKDPSEIERTVAELQFSNPTIQSIDYRPTGNLYGLERGKYGTTTRDYNWFKERKNAMLFQPITSYTISKIDSNLSLLTLNVSNTSSVSVGDNIVVTGTTPTSITTTSFGGKHWQVYSTYVDTYVTTANYSVFSEGDEVTLTGTTADGNYKVYLKSNSSGNLVRLTPDPNRTLTTGSANTAATISYRKLQNLNATVSSIVPNTSISMQISYPPSGGTGAGGYFYNNKNFYTYVNQPHLSPLGVTTSNFSDPLGKGEVDFINNVIKINPFDREIRSSTTGEISNGGVIYYPSSILAPNFDASNCNYFSTVFQTTKSSGVKKNTGICLLFNNNFPIFIGLSWADGSSTSCSAYVSGKFTVGSTSTAISIKDYGDNKIHRFSIFVESASTTNRNIHLFIDNLYIGKVYISALANSDDGLNPHSFKSNISIPSQIKNFGIFYRVEKGATDPLNNAYIIDSTQNPFYEIYGAKWNDDPNISEQQVLNEIIQYKKQYHFQSRKYLDNVAKNIPNSNKYYFWEALWSLKGFHFIDNLSFDYSPIDPRTAITGDITYTPSGEDSEIDDSGNVVTQYNLGLDTVFSTDLAKSSLISSPFKFSVAVTNNSTNNQYPNDLVSVNNGNYPKTGQYIALSTTDMKVGNATITPFTVYAQRQTFSNEYRLEKIFNSQNLSNSIQIDSAWIQNKNDANNLMKNMALLTSTFNNDISVSIFGNPLIQVGDFCQLIYSLKEIGYDQNSASIVPRYCFVKAVSHNYSSGFSTTLTLKPMFDIS